MQYFVIASSSLMPRDNRCMYMAHVCFMSVVVTVRRSVGRFVVKRPLLNILDF